MKSSALEQVIVFPIPGQNSSNNVFLLVKLKLVAFLTFA